VEKKKQDSLKLAVDREFRKLTGAHQIEPGEQQAVPPEQPAKPAGKQRLWLFLLLCLAGSTLLSFVVFKYIAPTIPHELIGTWQVADGPMKGATLEFRWYGAALATRLDKEGKKEITDSSVKVIGKRLLLTSVDGATGKQETVVQTILTLTEDELVFQDEDHKTYAMKRVRN